MRINIGFPIPDLATLPGPSRPGFPVPGGSLVITYPSNAFCPSASDPTPTVSGNVGAGTFSSTAGLVFVSTSTGQIDVGASTPNATAYTITYTDTNSAEATFNVTLNALDDAGFSYSASSFPQNASNPTPTITGLAGGTFSSTSGLVFVSTSTGEIDLSASTIASYTITYNTSSSGSSVCPNTSTQTVAVAAATLILPKINNVYSMEFDGTSDYIDIGLRPSLTATEFTWSFWIYPTSTSGTRAIYSQSSSSATFQQTGYLAVNGATLALDVWLTGTYSTGPNFVTLNEWQHIVATRDSSNIVRLYRNGVVFNSAGQAQTGGGPAANGYIGSWIYNGPPVSRGLYFGGKIDEGALFNVALTDSQILAIYDGTATVDGVAKTANLNSLPTPPIKWYRMGD